MDSPHVTDLYVLNELFYKLASHSLDFEITTRCVFGINIPD